MGLNSMNKKRVLASIKSSHLKDTLIMIKFNITNHTKFSPSTTTAPMTFPLKNDIQHFKNLIFKTLTFILNRLRCLSLMPCFQICKM